MNNKTLKLLGLTRILMGWIFLWAFVDKTFGLGYATSIEKSWLSGGSPTTGFLSHTAGPLSPIFQAMAGNTFVDWLFMMGLLLIGLSLILGIAMKLACYSGSLMMSLMYLASLPLANNPVVDDHIIYIMILMLLLNTEAGQQIGFYNSWVNNSIVKKYKILQ